ncbi:MAG: glycosyl hydrolase family 18 protein [Lachnospiraceae bacterium]|nr:glycosyl hydrolase family 18 protein [Lachnospiraceae bacterium]
MKKVIPVVVAIALILIVFGMSFGKTVYEKYSYGQDWADLNEYFEIFGIDDVPIILNNERIDKSARIIDGVYYFDQDTVETYFTERFYVDTNEELLLYSTPETTLETVLESGKVTDVLSGEVKDYNYPISVYKDDTLYIAIEYIKNIVGFSYEPFVEPNRMQLYLEDSDITVAKIKSDTQVRWRGGVKSEILTEVSQGDVVTVIEAMDDWTKVKTSDCYIGYVENSKLTSETTDRIVIDKCTYSEDFSYLTRDYKINMTWHNIEYPQDGYGLIEALATAKAVNVVSPTWYWITDNEGNFSSVANPNYAKTAHDMDIEVWALISDFHSGVEGLDMNELLSYTSKRRAFVDNLVNTLINDGADGVNIDFENISKACAPHYVQFIRELTIACHANNLVVSVDNFVPTEYTAHYNRHSQGEFVDYIVIMGYDEHYKGSAEAGSVSSIPWMQDGIENTLKYVPKERVINAVPFYTRVWMTDGGDVTSEAVTMATSQDFLSRNGLTAQWNEATYQNYAEISTGGILYQVWLEDADSMEVRLNVMEAAGIAGIASWKLGQETPDIWDLIEGYMSR